MDRTEDPAYGLGLEHGVNRLSAHNGLWARAADEEGARILAALGAAGLGQRVLGFEHYGSTAVPGLMAKPIIDLQLGVADIEDAIRFIPVITMLGYDDAGSQGIPDHHIFGLGTMRRVLAHVVVFQSEPWTRALRFRDRLRAEPDTRAAYEALKVDLARTSPDRARYTAGKGAFVVANSAAARS